jgi:hypothetical protein
MSAPTTIKLRVTSQGNVGIGTPTPLQKLHVAGGNLNVDSGGSYRISNVPVLTSGALGSSVVFSQLQTLGNLNTLNVTGSVNRPIADGITWTSRTSAADNDWTSVAYGNGLFVAVSNNGTGNRVMTSPDTWGYNLFVAEIAPPIIRGLV